MTEPASLIGQSVARPDDPHMLRGGARFTAEVEHPLLEGAAHVVFVGSTIAHGHIVNVETAVAWAAAGVLAVVTAADHNVVPKGSILPAYYPPQYAMPILAENKVRHVGEPVAAVVATSHAQAVDAAELVEIDYEPLPAVMDLEYAQSDQVLLFTAEDAARTQTDGATTIPADPDAPTNTVLRHDEPHDEAPFAAADIEIRQRIGNPRQSPAPMETHQQACVWTDDGHLHVWATTQRPHGFRDTLAAMYQLWPDQVHVTAPRFVGGGFGGKVSRTAEEAALPELARIVGRPVRWNQTRGDYLRSATQGRGERMDLRLGGTRGGRILALECHMLKDAGAYPGVGANLPGRFNSHGSSGPYDIAHVEFNAISVVTNAPQVSALRGAGRAAYLAALERMIDIYAARIGMDPVEVRRLNLVQPQQMPFTAVTGVVYDEADYPGDMEHALDLAGYNDLRELQAQRRLDISAPQIGIGVAAYHLMTVGGGAEEAKVVIRPQGGATVYTGTTSQGHGHDATWAQIAADTLGMRLDHIDVFEGSTTYTDSGVGAVGSRSMQTAGIAVHNSSQALVEQARHLAAQLLEASVEDIQLAPARAEPMPDGTGGCATFHVAGVPRRSLTWADLASHLQTEDRELSCGEVFDIGDNNSFPSGTHIAVVEIDPETGQVDVLRFVGVDDAGVRVNPMIVEGQLHGGIALGISQVLGEMMHYDEDGNPLTTGFADYAIATADMLPSFELTASETATSFNVLGVKGVGESGPVGAVGALHNAIVDALAPFGVEHLELPCTPERIWQAIRHRAQ